MPDSLEHVKTIVLAFRLLADSTRLRLLNSVPIGVKTRTFLDLDDRQLANILKHTSGYSTTNRAHERNLETFPPLHGAPASTGTHQLEMWTDGVHLTKFVGNSVI